MLKMEPFFGAFQYAVARAQQMSRSRCLPLCWGPSCPGPLLPHVTHTAFRPAPHLVCLCSPSVPEAGSHRVVLYEWNVPPQLPSLGLTGPQLEQTAGISRCFPAACSLAEVESSPHRVPVRWCGINCGLRKESPPALHWDFL